jgi:hypothetical protein
LLIDVGETDRNVDRDDAQRANRVYQVAQPADTSNLISCTTLLIRWPRQHGQPAVRNPIDAGNHIGIGLLGEIALRVDGNHFRHENAVSIAIGF